MMRLYICAAAKDMAAERELMHTYVLPELNDRLAEHGIQVVADDPRSEDDYVALSAAERAAEAFDRIDRARPWFVAFVGDAVDESPVALPADVLARHPWVSEYPGASVVELELAYGALIAPGERKPLVYLRDDRFLRDVPLDQRGDYSSEDLETVGRLENLKGRLRESGVQLVDGYHCRWDSATDRVNDLDELGKQLVEDLYDAIMQAEHPELQLGVLDELPASGAAVGMVNQAGEGPLRSNSSGEAADDDLNFDMEDILDVDAGLKDSSSASAIEGVEPLDFLDDDGPSATPPRSMEPTIQYDAGSMNDDDTGFDLTDEVLEIEEIEVADAASLDDDDDEAIDEIITLDDVEVASDDTPSSPLALTGDEETPVDVDVDDMFAEAEPLTDLSDMVDEPLAAEESASWASSTDADEISEIPQALAVPPTAMPVDSSSDEAGDWLAEPVAEAEPIVEAESFAEGIEVPAAQPVGEFEDLLSDENTEPPMAEPFAATPADNEFGEPELIGDDDAFLADPIAESPEPPKPAFDTTLAWSPGAGPSAAGDELSDAIGTDENLDDDDIEEMDIDLVEEAEAVSTGDQADGFADDVPSAQPVIDDVNDIPLAFGEPVDAAAENADDDGLGMFLDTPEEAIAEQAAESQDDDFTAFLEEPAIGETAAAAGEVSDEADDGGWNFDDVEADAPAGAMFVDNDQTIRHTSEATEISEVDDEMPVAAAEEEDEFRLQEEAASVTSAAPVVASSYAPSPARKKKSSLPMILVALALLLIVGGGAGAYFAGLIPGLGGGNNVAENTPTPPVNPDANNFVAKINENSKKLTDLFNSAKNASGEIDGTKLQEAQTLIANLEANDPDVAAEEPIQAIKARITHLAGDFEKQKVESVEKKRQDDFRKALELAGAGAPMSLDQGFLDDAKNLAASDDERNLIAALEQQVSDYATEQARLAAEQSGMAKTEALAAIAAATGDAQDFSSAIDAFVAANPADPAVADLEASKESEGATLDAVATLNQLAADWSKLDMRKLSAADAQQQIDSATAATARTAALPGAAEITARVEMLKPIAAHSAAPQFAGGAIDAPLILGMKDGKRYYLTAKPTSKDGKLVATYVSDLTGATAEAEVVPAEIDRASSAPSSLPATAKSVNDALATADAGWEPAFIKALLAVQKDAKMDPVVKTQWLLMLTTAGGQGSRPLANAFGDFSKLAETGVDANFNWADPAAAAAVREKCAAAIAALPQLIPLAQAAAKEYGNLASLTVPAPATPVGVLLKGVDDTWTVQLAEGAPQSGVLMVLAADSADAPLAATNIGTIEAGETVLDDAADKTGWTQGRVVYANTAATAPEGN